MSDQQKAAVALDIALDATRLALAAAGAILVGIGGWLHYPPLGFAAGGAMLYAVAVIGALKAKS
ncbi:MAG: hypothetical protein K0S00_4420 [Xanthobacteraceae bacterium]|jgi:hypothetical protein|nr:hypothetical protein [Xanthobacteraceae bacterium]